MRNCDRITIGSTSQLSSCLSADNLQSLNSTLLGLCDESQGSGFVVCGVTRKLLPNMLNDPSSRKRRLPPHPLQSRMCSMRNLVERQTSACCGLAWRPGHVLAWDMSTNRREAWSVDRRASLQPACESPAMMSVSKAARPSRPSSGPSSSLSEQESLP